MNSPVKNAALLEPAALAQQTLQALPLAACLVDRDGKVVMANDLWREVLPLQATALNSIIGANIFVLIEGLDCADPALARFATELRALLAGSGNTASGEYVRLIEGRPRWYEVRAARLAGDASGRWMLMHHDITARRAAQARAVALEAGLDKAVEERTRELQQRIDELESFTRAVAHDLRNPLFAVDGLARELMQSPMPGLTRETRECLMAIARSATQMAEILDGLRTLTRSVDETPRKQRVDLAAMAREIGDVLMYRFRYRKVALTIGALPPLESDPHLLRVVIQNLIENAWKYTARSAQAKIELGGRHDADGTNTYFVRDNGVGFANGATAKMFLPNKRVASGNGMSSNGIGLATVKRIVEKLHGRVWVEDNPNGGVTFFFSLPRTA